MTSPELDRIAALVRERTGLVFPESRSVVVESVVRRAMSAARIAHAGLYAEALDRDTALLDDLFAELTVGETYFFRESAQLEYVRCEVLSRLRGLGRGVRVWSAGCATGEEPYTLSIMLHEEGLAQGATVLGTDLSRARLRLAQRGEYRSWSMRGVPEGVVDRYFSVRQGRYAVAPRIKAPVEFRHLNLTADAFPSPALGVWGEDLIFCRNVLIYLDESSVRCVAGKLVESLTEEGWLFLGASDPMLAELVPCDVVITPAGLAYRRRRALRFAAGGDDPTWRERAEGGGGATGAVVAESVVGEEVTPTPPATPFEVSQAAASPGVMSLPSSGPPRAGSPPGDEALPPDATAELWAGRVRELANLGRLREAGDACAAALDRYRASAELTYLHAVLLSEAGRHADAAAAARRALYLDRSMVVAHLALGGALRRTGDVAGARRAFANALALLDGMPPGALVPASGGEPAARLAAVARVQLQLSESAA